MFRIGKKIARITKIRDLKSRYDRYADYNPHYNCKMDKAHITMIGTLPVYMTHTKGGSIHMKYEKKLRFLYENGRKKQAGMHLRNENIENEVFEEEYSKRAECERIHKNIKWTVKFDIRGMKNASKEMYSIMNFVAYQLLVTANLQNKIKQTNSFANYV